MSIIQIESGVPTKEIQVKYNGKLKIQNDPLFWFCWIWDSGESKEILYD